MMASKQNAQKLSMAHAKSALVVAVAVALFLAINALIGRMSPAITQLDVSSMRVVTPSAQTGELLSALSQDVTLYLVAPDELADPWVPALLARYETASSHVHVQRVNATSDLVTRYSASGLTAGSVIVESSARGKAIGYEDLYQTQYFYDNYTGSYVQNTVAFHAEGQLTSAIEYVTRSDLPAVYALTGHGETAVSGHLATALADANVAVSSLDLATAGAVPGDAACLMISAPQSDLSAPEVQAILAYLASGGRVVLITDCTQPNLPNLLSIAEYYGMAMQTGIVLEGDSSHYMSDSSNAYPHYILPELVTGDNEIVTVLSAAGVATTLPVSHAIVPSTTTRPGLTVTNLLTTSDVAFLKPNINALTTLDREDADIAGPFILAAAAQEQSGDVTAKLVWVGSAQFMTDMVDSAVGGGNSQLLIASMHYLVGELPSISIPTKNMVVSGLSFTGSQPYVMGALMVGLPILLPLLAWIVVAGVKRRKRRVNAG